MKRRETPVQAKRGEFSLSLSLFWVEPRTTMCRRPTVGSLSRKLAKCSTFPYLPGWDYIFDVKPLQKCTSVCFAGGEVDLTYVSFKVFGKTNFAKASSG